MFKFSPVWAAPAVFLIDRLLKNAVLERLAVGETRAVFPGMFHITHVSNTGAAFGILKGSVPFLIFTTVCAVFTIVFLLNRRSASWLENLAWALVLGGALGNLYDRLVYGHVVDFIDLRVWPVFNLADSAICAGVVLVLFCFAPRMGMRPR